MKFVIILLLFILTFTVTSPALASVCHKYQEHQICILRIQRSAKNYWEYRVVLSIDEVQKPMQIYNCREIQKDDLGKFVCNYFK